MNTPNRLTLARMILSPLFLLLFLWEFPFHTLLSGVVFGAAALTDLFDGRLARKYGQITSLGKFLDPIADKMLTTAAFLAFVACDQMNVWALFLILTREFVVTSVRLVAAEGGKVVAANIWGKIKTVMQFIAILYLLVALEFASWQDTVLQSAALPEAVFTVPLVVGQVLLWIAAVMTAVSGVTYFWDNRRFFLPKSAKNR